MSLPQDVRPGVPGASPQPDQAELQLTYGQVYDDLKTYFGQQTHSSAYELVEYTLDGGAEFSLLMDITDIFEDELLEEINLEDFQIPGPKSQPPDSAFIRLSDTAERRIIRFGLTFRGESEGQPSRNFGVELNLDKTDGTIGVYESHTYSDGMPQATEERVKTERAQVTPDKLRKIAQIIGKYSPSGDIHVRYKVNTQYPKQQAERVRAPHPDLSAEEIWAGLESTPGSNEQMVQAIEDVNAGGGAPRPDAES